MTPPGFLLTTVVAADARLMLVPVQRPLLSATRFTRLANRTSDEGIRVDLTIS